MDGAVAISGTGVVTAQGVGVEATWEGVAAGREVLRPWEGVPEDHPLARLRVACCPELPRPDDLPPRLWKRLSRTQQLACVAADEALARAGLPRRLESYGPVGLFLATTVCGMDQNERFYAQYRVDRESADVDLMRRLQPYEVGALLARRHRLSADPEAELRGVYLTTCVGSAMAIGAACDAILAGACDLAIAGGSEALCRVVLSGFHALKVVAADGCRPFDLDRPGITVGEGAGVLVLESVAQAQRRGATPLAFVRGFGLTCDAHHITAPDAEGTQAARAIRDALQRAAVQPSEIDYINAHGTGTRDNDAMETRALRAVFGDATPPVSSTKRCTGHTFAAAGAIEAALCVEALRGGVFPVNAGSVTADPALPLPVVRGASLKRPMRVALSTNFAFGGNNAALVMAREAGPSVSRKSPGSARPELGICGLGVVTDAYPDAREFLPHDCRDLLERMEVLDAEAAAAHDVLAQLVIRAAHQAWTMAGQQQIGGDRMGLIFVSGWGTIDATVDYLESMLESDGRYASPRHFARSVYSSVASVTAIHFGIRGPCETLCFDSAPVAGGLHEAQRLLRAGRCDRVMVVWAEQAADIALDLARRAVERLGRREFTRFTKGPLGYGAVAVILSADEPAWRLDISGVAADAGWSAARNALRGGPFATDTALAFAARVGSAYSPK